MKRVNRWERHVVRFREPQTWWLLHAPRGYAGVRLDTHDRYSYWSTVVVEKGAPHPTAKLLRTTYARCKTVREGSRRSLRAAMAAAEEGLRLPPTDGAHA